MYCDYFGLRCRPFEDRADTRFLHQTPETEETLAAMEYAAQHGEGIALVMGEAGTGKTMLCRALVQRLSATDRAVILTMPTGRTYNIVRETCKAFGVLSSNQEHGGRTRPLHHLEKHLWQVNATGYRAILILDQAENLTPQSMTAVAALHELQVEGRPLLQIILVGQPQIMNALNDPRFSRLKQRVYGAPQLVPMAEEQIGGYLQQRLRVAGLRDAAIFDPAAAEQIHRAARGIPRLVDHIADACLLHAYAAQQKTVTPAIVLEVTEADTTLKVTSEATATTNIEAAEKTGQENAERASTDDAQASIGDTEAQAVATADQETNGESTESRREDDTTGAADEQANDRSTLAKDDSASTAGSTPEETADTTSASGGALQQAAATHSTKESAMSSKSSGSSSRPLSSEAPWSSAFVGDAAAAAPFTGDAFASDALPSDAAATPTDIRQLRRGQMTATKLETLLQRGEALTERLERTLLRAEQMQSSQEASLAEHTCVDEHLAALSQTARHLVGQLGQSLNGADEAITQAADRATNLWRETDARLHALEGRTAKLGTAHDAAQKQLDKLDQASARAADTREQLNTYAEQLASQAERTQERISLLMSSTEAGNETHRAIEELAEQLQREAKRLEQIGEDATKRLHEEAERIQHATADVTRRIHQEAESASARVDEAAQNAKSQLVPVIQQAQATRRQLTEEAVQTCRDRIRELMGVLDARIRSKSDAVSELTNLQQTLEANLTAAEKRGTDLGGQVATLEAALNGASQKATEIGERTARTDQHLIKQQARLHGAVAEMKETMSAGQELVADVNAACQRLETLNKTSADALVRVGAAAERVRQLEEDAERCTHTLTNLAFDHDAHVNLARELQESHAQASQVREAIHRELVEANDKIGKLDSHNAAAKAVLHQLGEANINSHRALSEVERRTGEAEERFCGLEAKTVRLHETIENAEVAARTISAQTAAFEDLIGRTEGAREALSQQLARVSGERSGLEQVLDQAHDAQQRLISIRSSAQSSLEELVTTLDSLSVERSELSTWVNRMREPIDRAQQLVDRLGNAEGLLADLEVRGQSLASRESNIRTTLIEAEEKLSDFTQSALRQVGSVMEDREASLERRANEVAAEIEAARDATLESIAGASQEQFATAKQMLDELTEMTRDAGALHGIIEGDCRRADEAVRAMGDLTGKQQRIREMAGVLEEHQRAWSAQCAAVEERIAKLSCAERQAGETISDLERLDAEVRATLPRLDEGRQANERVLADCISRCDELRQAEEQARQTQAELVDAAGRGLATRDNLQQIVPAAAKCTSQLETQLDRVHEEAETLQNACGRAGQILKRLPAITRLLSTAREAEDRLTKTTQNAQEAVARFTQATGSADAQLQALEDLHRSLQALCDTQEALNAQASELRQELDEQRAGARETLSQMHEADETGRGQLAQLDERGRALGEVTDRAAKLMERLTARAEEIETGEEVLKDFVGQCEHLAKELGGLRGQADEVQRSLSEAIARPAEVAEQAQTQAAHLERVCKAVRKVFAGLSQAAVHANKQVAEFKVASRETMERMQMLQTETNRASATLAEWVDEAREVQNRLVDSLRSAPPRGDTRPSDSLDRLSRLVDTSGRRFDLATTAEAGRAMGTESAPPQRISRATPLRSEEVNSLLKEVGAQAESRSE
jgi:MSHA biogenesis protein MshM